MKRDSSFNVYWQRKISFEDRVVVEGSKTSSINQYMFKVFKLKRGKGNERAANIVRHQCFSHGLDIMK